MVNDSIKIPVSFSKSQEHEKKLESQKQILKKLVNQRAFITECTKNTGFNLCNRRLIFS